MRYFKYLSVLLHVLCWLIFFSLVLYFVEMPGDDQFSNQHFFDLPHVVFYTIFPAIFYLNLGLLFPRLFLRKKYKAYFIVMLVIFVVEFYLQPFDRLMSHSGGRRRAGTDVEFGPPPGMRRGETAYPTQPADERRPPSEREMPPLPGYGGEPGEKNHSSLRRDPDSTDQPARRPKPGVPGPGKGNPNIDIMSIILFVVTWSLSSGIAIFRQWRTTEQRALHAEADKAKAELSFLRAQINPHFLFNTLNNIYSMAVMKSDATAESIMKLSNIMRYVTDEGKENFVMLQDEIDCLRDYIDLQRIRLGNKTKLDFKVTGLPKGEKVVPLLFMTFVENAFKYGTSNHLDSAIEIHLIISDEKIVFTCRNSIFEKGEKTERTGIGIQNARQRLASLYPLTHQLDIFETDNIFSVRLELINPQIKDT
jgi:two-component system LytT family sensor kinase